MRDESPAVGARHVVKPVRRSVPIVDEDHAFKTARLCGRQLMRICDSRAARDDDRLIGNAALEAAAGGLAKPLDVGKRQPLLLRDPHDGACQRMAAEALEGSDERQHARAIESRPIVFLAQTGRP